MRKTHYTCRELAELRLPELPGTERGWRKVVEREAWPFREVQVKGGKGGIAREYAPTPRVAKLIDCASAAGAGGAKRKTVEKVVTLTVALPASEAAALLQWLNGRGDHA